MLIFDAGMFGAAPLTCSTFYHRGRCLWVCGMRALRIPSARGKSIGILSLSEAKPSRRTTSYRSAAARKRSPGARRGGGQERARATKHAEQRTHQQRSSDADCAHHLGCLSHVGNLFFGDAAVSMGTGDDTQGSIVLTTHVEVKPDGDHVLQHLSRRLHVQHVRFHRPWAVAFCFDTFLRRWLRPGAMAPSSSRREFCRTGCPAQERTALQELVQPTLGQARRSPVPSPVATHPEDCARRTCHHASARNWCQRSAPARSVDGLPPSVAAHPPRWQTFHFYRVPDVYRREHAFIFRQSCFIRRDRLHCWTNRDVKAKLSKLFEESAGLQWPRVLEAPSSAFD